MERITHHLPGARRPDTEVKKRALRAAGNQGSGGQRGTFQGADGSRKSTGGSRKPTGGGSPPTGGKPTCGKPTGGKPTGGKPTGGKPTGGKPTGGKPTGGKPTGGKPTGGKPTGGGSTPANGDGQGGNKYDQSGFGKDGKHWQGQDTVLQPRRWKGKQTPENSSEPAGDSDQISSELKADSLPVRRRATHAPTPSWYSVCAKVLSYRKDDAFTDKEALIEFIKTLFERRTSDEEIERSKTNDQGPPDR